MFLLLLASPGFLFGEATKTQQKILSAGDRFPAISLSDPLDPAERKYLGIGTKKIFHIDDIQGDLILIQYLGAHCMHCISSIPIFSQAYQAIEDDPATKKRIKMIAIASGSTPTETKDFKQRYAVPYPILSDSEFEAHKAVGEPRVPFIVAARKDRQRRWVVAVAEVGLVEFMSAQSSSEANWVAVTVPGGEVFSVEDFVEALKAMLPTSPAALKKKALSPSTRSKGEGK